MKLSHSSHKVIQIESDTLHRTDTK